MRAVLGPAQEDEGELMDFTDAVKSVEHAVNCASRMVAACDAPFEHSYQCDCDRDIRIAKGIDAVVETAGEDGTCGEVSTISELIVIFMEAAK